jgi:hypothetical protein
MTGECILAVSDNVHQSLSGLLPCFEPRELPGPDGPDRAREVHAAALLAKPFDLETLFNYSSGVFAPRPILSSHSVSTWSYIMSPSTDPAPIVVATLLMSLGAVNATEERVGGEARGLARMPCASPPVPTRFCADHRDADVPT